MNIAYFGYDFFYSCLEEILDQGHTVQKVFSFPCDNIYNFNKRVQKCAQDLGIEFSLEKVTESDISDLKAKGCELIIVAGYQYKISLHPSLRAINIHPTLLPEGRGQWPLPWVILKDLKKSGVTIHKLAEEMDAGDILLQEQFDISEFETLEILSAKSQMQARELLSQMLKDFDSYWERAKPQMGTSSVFGMPTISERTFDWNKTGDQLMRIVRAFGKFDSFAIFDNKEWIVQDAKFWSADHEHIPGTIVQRMDREIVIAVKDGFLCLTQFCIDPDFKE